MDEWLQLLFICVGIFAGGFFGVEYGNWRVGRRIKNYESMLFNLLGINYEKFSKGSPEDQRKFFKMWVKERLVPVIKQTYQEFFPDLNLPKPPPSRITGLNGKKFYVPHCPQCGFAASPVYNVMAGILVQASCPTHGTYKQRVPENKITQMEKDEE